MGGLRLWAIQCCLWLSLLFSLWSFRFNKRQNLFNFSGGFLWSTNTEETTLHQQRQMIIAQLLSTKAKAVKWVESGFNVVPFEVEIRGTVSVLLTFSVDFIMRKQLLKNAMISRAFWIIHVAILHPKLTSHLSDWNLISSPHNEHPCQIGGVNQDSGAWLLLFVAKLRAACQVQSWKVYRRKLRWNPCSSLRWRRETEMPKLWVQICLLSIQTGV